MNKKPEKMKDIGIMEITVSLCTLLLTVPTTIYAWIMIFEKLFN